ncbi:hypothetical protein PUN28_007507 [Cardiocondyla obscurior]|uniref:Uncharacterized protein n=1 Tax=Cardiocondyla obscurior TaxID=286306 RepID=A0AAW2G3K7_9HYME
MTCPNLIESYKCPCLHLTPRNLQPTDRQASKRARRCWRWRFQAGHQQMPVKAVKIINLERQIINISVLATLDQLFDKIILSF